jgi:enoyl-CoA hydratase/carnithine racemase
MLLRIRCFSSEAKKLVTVTEVEKGIFHVLLNRPEKMNALSLDMFETITSTAVSLRENKAIRAVILSGNGKAFCTGLDVKSVAVNPLNFPKLLNKPGQTILQSCSGCGVHVASASIPCHRLIARNVFWWWFADCNGC